MSMFIWQRTPQTAGKIEHCSIFVVACQLVALYVNELVRLYGFYFFCGRNKNGRREGPTDPLKTHTENGLAALVCNGL